MELQTVETQAELKECWRALKRSLHTVYDCETTGLDPYTDDVLLMQFCTDDGTVWLVPAYAEWTAKALPHLLSAMCGEEKLIIGHNIRFDYQFALVRLGIQLTNMWDTQLAEAVLVAGNPGKKTNLGDTLKRRLDLVVDKDLQKSWVGVDKDTFIPSDEQLAYAVDDVTYLHRLRYAQLDKLITENTLHIAELEFDAIPAFAEMELTGMQLDEEAHRAVIEEYALAEEANKLAAMKRIAPAYGNLCIKWNSKLVPRYAARTAEVEKKIWRKRVTAPPEGCVQLGSTEAKALYAWRDKLKPKSPTIGIGNDVRVKQALRNLGISKRLLPDLQAQTVAMALPQLPEGPGKEALAYRAAWKKAQKITSTYGYSMSAKRNPVTGKIHPHYNQLVSTGRTSSNNPNGQNMPKRIRKCFIAGASRKFVIADFAAMELRILAGMSLDPVMLAAFNLNQDLHRVTAAATWPEKFSSWEEVPNPSVYRDLGKRGNFGYIYGASAKGLWLRGVMPDLETAERVREAYLARYAVAWEWITDRGMDALEHLHGVTALGRKRYFRHPGPQPRRENVEKYDAWRKARGSIRRQGMNHPIQGTGADIAKLAMTRLQQQFRVAGMDAHLCTMVHDELVVNCAAPIAERVADMLHEAMVNAGAYIFHDIITIDADVSIKDRWEKD